MISILNLEPKDYSSEARSLIGSIGKIYDGPFTRDELIQEIPKFDALNSFFLSMMVGIWVKLLSSFRGNFRFIIFN